MDLTRLQTFKELCETRSFTKTAKRLFVTQPAVSQHIKKLQVDLQIKLIQKIDNNIVLTSKGKALYESIKNELSSLSDTMNNINSNQIRSKILIMGPYVYLNNFLIPRLAKNFSNKIYFQIQFSNSYNSNEALLSSEIDLTVVSSPLKSKAVQSKKIFEEKMVLICNNDYYKKIEKNIKEKKVNLNIVDMSGNLRLFKLYQDINKLTPKITPRLVARIHSIEGIINFVRNSDSAAVVPYHLVEHHIRNKELVVLFKNLNTYKNTLYLSKLKRRVDPVIDEIFAIL